MISEIPQGNCRLEMSGFAVVVGRGVGHRLESGPLEGVELFVGRHTNALVRGAICLELVYLTMEYSLVG